MNAFFKKYPLASQILIKVFSIYFIVAVLVTSVHLYWQYNDTKSFIAKEIENTFHMVSEGLAKSLWEYDEVQVTKTLKGLELLPFISSVVVLDADGKYYTSDNKENITRYSLPEKQKNNIDYSGPLIIKFNKGNKKSDQVVGYLTLYGDKAELFKRLELGFWLLIINALIKTLAIWMIFMVIGHFMISRPLSALINATKAIDFTSSEQMTVDVRLAQENELTVLESTFNKMFIRLFTAKKQLEYKANYDGLTGLPNRAFFIDRLSLAINQADRAQGLLAVLLIDLDKFKEINDSLGHGVGDEVLKEISLRLSKEIRKTDTLARIGGDEFTIILDSLEDKLAVINIIEKLNKTTDDAINIDNQTLYTTLSIGIAFYPDDANTPANLLKYADTALYSAKDKGRNNFQYYSKEMTEKAIEYLSLERRLRHAIENHEFVVFYQPQVLSDNNYIFGMEALVRWNHPELGMISPDKFIPLAEKTGLIIPIGEEVFDIATKQIVKWMANASQHYRVAINLSVKQLQQQNIVSRLTKILEKNSCNPEWVCLEVTEGYLMNNPELAIQTLQDFSDIGIEIAIDDFGTGYSSLSYLKRLPVKKLKIDQSFVRDLSVDQDDKIIVESIIYLAKAMNLKVIAEGVETLVQKEFLLSKGCKEIQGYFYSKPVPEIEMSKLLQAKFINIDKL